MQKEKDGAIMTTYKFESLILLIRIYK